MKQDIIQNKINEVVDQFILEAKIRMKVRKMVSEKIQHYLREDDGRGKSKESKSDSEEMQIKRNTVVSLLKKDMVKNAPLAYKIWPDMDEDTARSLFSKMVTGKPDNDGVVRKFTDDDISKLYELLRQI